MECKSYGEPRARREATEAKERDEAFKRKMADHLRRCAFCDAVLVEQYFYDGIVASAQWSY